MIEEPAASHPTYWLTTLELDPGQAPAPETIRRRLAAEAIEARLLWKPLHLQPLYRHNRCIHWGHAERRFERGLCLPSGSQLAAEAQDHICETIAACFEQAADLG
jgi:dTDP-4-amino-4,6-dideoxygalactose transaminase